MTPYEFYQRYGQYIYRAQQYSKVFNVFPYIRPDESKIMHWATRLAEKPNWFETKFKCLGYNYPQTLLTAVIWKPQLITYYPIHRNAPIISYEFGGCYMAKFELEDQWYACHIHSFPGDDCCSLFYRFYCSQCITNFSMYRPTNIHDDIFFLRDDLRKFWNKRISNSKVVEKKIQIAGLFDAKGNFFSLCIDTETAFPYYIEKKDFSMPVGYLLNN